MLVSASLLAIGWGVIRVLENPIFKQPWPDYCRQGKFQIFGDCGYSPPLLGMIWIVSINVFRSKRLIVIEINGHFGGQKMAYYALAFSS